jgi:hypothetical protein
MSVGTPASNAEVVIRPRPGGAPDRTRFWFALAFAPIAVVGVARGFDHSVQSGLWYGAGALTLAALAVLARANFFAQTSIAVSASSVCRTGYLGRSASCPRETIARVLEVTAITARVGGLPATWLLFLDADGVTLMRAYAEYYPREELLRLRDALGVDWDVRGDVRTFAQYRRDIPGSFPWPLAHVWLTLALVALLVVVIGSAIAVGT